MISVGAATRPQGRGRRRVGQWSPAYVPDLVAWWDARTLTGGQSWAPVVGAGVFGSAQSGSTAGSESSDPAQVAGVSTSFDGGDWWQIPDNAQADFAAGESFTAAIVVSDLGPAAATNCFLSKGAAFVSSVGWSLGFTSTSVFARISDGSANVAATQASRPASKALVALVRNVATDTLSLSVNGIVVASSTDTTTGTLANAEPLYFGKIASSNFGVFTMYGFLLARAAVAAADLARVADWYGIA